MTGIKASVKKELRNLGVKTISIDKKSVKLQNAKTTDLISALAKLK